MEKDYNQYDRIVSRTLEIIHPLVYDEPIIFLNYERNICNDFIFKMCSMWSDLMNKEIYISTESILNYLILKIRKYKTKKIKYKKNIPLESDIFCISPEKIILQICDEFLINKELIEDVYKTYYTKREK